MDNFENKLRHQPLKESSDKLKQRMDTLFQVHEFLPVPFWSRPIRLWQCTAACLACLGIGVLSTILLQPETIVKEKEIREQTVYIVPADPEALARLTGLDPERIAHPVPVGAATDEVHPYTGDSI